MTLTKMIVMVAAIGIGATTYLSVLAEAGLGDFSDNPGVELPAVVSTEAAPAAPSTPGSLQVTAKDTKFDNTSLTAPAGKVTIDFNNEDSTPHNLDIYSGSDAKGDSLAKTPIKTGPEKASLSVELKPGKYYFQCDVHPDQMHGFLTVT